jgi:filamentous hemagglutinin
MDVPAFSVCPLRETIASNRDREHTMNARLHRVIFNAARGIRMVVQETATSNGKGASKSTGGCGVSIAGVSALALMATLAAIPAAAQITAAPSAPGNQRATILAAPNGVPLVNIQSPSAAGVSRNTFSQFDVNAPVAILNNSRTSVATQLGGLVQGNPYLASGPARVILNEVNSSNPSYLRGYVEVAGTRAEVIIANPAGIQVDGGGFINASKVTLTTGTPQFNAGAIESFLVRGGTIVVDGKGLDLSRTDYAAILTRALNVNAGIWANSLKVVTGVNQVSADASQVTPTTGTGSAPTFALDVATLGGMYAGKIVLLGTEAGVGVRNAGTLSASAANMAAGQPTLSGVGEFVITAAGRLENTGAIQAAASAALTATGLGNSGRIVSATELAITTQGDLANTLNGTGGTLEAQRLVLASTAGDIDNRNGGTMRQTGATALTVAASTVSNTAGGTIGAEPAPVAPPATGGGSGAGGTGGTDISAPPPDTSIPGIPGTPAYVPPAPGTITAAGTIRNDGGHVYAGGTIDLQAQTLINTGGTLSIANLAVNQSSFSNAGGTLNIANAFSARVGSFDNTGGHLNAGSLLIATTGDLLNADGTLTSAGDTTLAAGGSLANARGRVAATGALTATVTGALDNTAGTLIANDAVALTAQSLDNTQGAIHSAQSGVQLNIGQQLRNDQGAIGAATDLTVQTGSLANGTGSLRAGNDATVNVSGAFTTDGSLTAGRHTTVTAGSLQGSSTSVLGAGVQNDGTLAATGNLTVTTAQTLAAQGQNLAAGSMALAGSAVDLTGSKTSAAAIGITATQGNVTTSKATVSTSGLLAITANANAAQTLVNDAGTLSAGQLDVDVSNLSNIHAGQVIQAGTGATRIAVAGTLTNTGGSRIASNGESMAVSAGTLANDGGQLQHAGTGAFDLAVGTMTNAQGQVVSNGALALHGGTISNNAGTVSAQRIAIDAASLSNRAGTLTQIGTGATHIAVTGDLDNGQGGSIASNGTDLSLQVGGALTNTSGTIAHAGTGMLNITVATLGNAQGQIVGNGVLGLHGGDLNNDSGSINARQIGIDAASLSNQAGGKITQTGTGETILNVTGVLTNNAGTIASNGNTTVTAASLSNQGGAIRAAGTADLALTVGGLIDNSAAGELGAGGDTTLVAGTLNNGAGRITAVGNLNATVSGAASNVAGTLAANGSTTITAASLNNTSGTIAAVNGDLSVTTSGATTNAGGTLQAGGNATLSNAGLDNTAGKVVGHALAIDTHSNTLTNTGGTLASTTTLTLDSGALNNDTGLIQSGGAMRVDTHGQALTNTHAAGHASGQGGLTSGGTLNLSSGALDNSAGFIGATASLTASTGTFTNARGGSLISQGALSVNTNGAAYNNQGGQTQAAGDITINAGTGALDNTSSLIRSGGTTTLNAGTVNNASTRGTNQGIEGANVAITTGTLTNSLGTIRSDADTTITSAGTVNNAGGLITAQGNLSLLDPNAASLGANPTAKTLTVINTGGTLAANQSLVLDAARFSGDGQLVAGQDLSLALTQDITNNATVQANRNLSYATTGTLTNNGTLHAGNTLTVSGADVINNAGAEMSAGQSTRVTAANTLTNRGLIDGVDTQINAGTLNNLGTGRIYGYHLSIAAGTLNNAPEIVNGVTTAASIAARSTLDIGAGTINNSDEALIYSAGDMYIGGALDGNRNATGQANAINNSSATIQSMGDMSLAAVAIRNTNPHLVVGTQQVASTHVNMILPLGWSTPLPASDFVSANGHLYQKAHPTLYQTLQPAAPATVVTPGACNGDNGCDPGTSTSEAANSPRFAQFGVTPPVVRPLPVASDYGCIDFGAGGVSCSNPAQAVAYSTALSAAQNANAASYQTALASLTTAIDTYNAQVTEDNRLTEVGHQYTYYSYDDTVTRNVITAGGDKGAIISAGGDLVIHGLLTNQDSSVTAGGTLSADQTPVNTQTQGQQVERFTGGTATFYHWKYHGGFSDSYSLEDDGPAAYGPAPVVTTYPLSSVVYQGGLNTATALPIGAGTGTSGPVQNAGAGQANATNRSSVITEVAANVGDVAPNSGGGTGGANGAGTTPVNGAPGAGSTSAAPTVPVVVRTSTPNLTLPTASLFHTNASLNGHPLIETDPRFTNMRQWLSSDYLLNALGYAPDNVQKRLGDGFYEQQLINQQINQLTGYRLLDGFSNDQDQYSALMNAGVTFARAYGLRPGIALTAAQMAQLTSDIVWLVSQTVTLPDGSTQTVLVPQVYVRVKPGDIDGSGALLSADRMVIKGAPGAGDLTNSGTIAGRSLVAITSDNINNLGGRITGGTVALTARNDLNNLGGSIIGANAVVLSAGHDINVASTTQSTTGVNAANTQTNLDRVAGVYVTNPAGVLVASAGNDVNVIGAILSNTGVGSQTQVKAGHDINLGAVSTARQTDVTWDAKNYLRTASSQDIGSQIVGAGNMALNAGRDLNINASTVASRDGALTSTAARDINITAGQSSQSRDEARNHSKSGLLSSSSETRRDSVATTDVVTSSLSGNTVALVAGRDITTQAAVLQSEKSMSLSAGRDITLGTADQSATESHFKQNTKTATGLGKLTGIAMGADTVGAKLISSNAALTDGAVTRTNSVGTVLSAGSLQTVSGRNTTVTGSTIVADNDITMIAGNNLTIQSAQNTEGSDTFNATRKSGMIGSTFNPSFGNVKQDQGTHETGVTQTASQVASLKGNVTLVAGNTYTQTASSVLAAGQAGPLAGGDVNILAKTVNIGEAYNTSSGTSVTHSASTVLGGSASVAGISTDTLRGAKNTISSIGSTGDSRMKALAAVNLAIQGSQVATAAQSLASGEGMGFKVAVNLSRNTSESHTTQAASEAVGSSIAGAHNVNIVATGGGQSSNIRAVDSTITAGDTVNLVADNAINLEASKSSFEQHGTNSSNGASIGVGFAVGAQNGFTIELGVSKGKGKGDASDVMYTNTQVSGGKTVNVSSGGDLNLKGAVIAAPKVNADVGGNLNIQSLQDTSLSDAKQSSAGLNASLCIPPICYGVSTVGGSLAAAKAKGDFASVTEQSGIKAGDGGFNVNVAGNTDLKGGVISSTQAAIDAGKNSFRTASLTTSDIENRSAASASSFAVSGSMSGAVGDQSSASTPADQKAAKDAGANSRPGGSAGAGSASGTETGTTKSGISGIAGDQSVRTGDAASTGAIVKTWNTDTLIKDVQAQAQITQEFGQNASAAVGNYANAKYNEFKDSNPAEAAKWAEGGEYRVAAHAVIGGLTGGLQGALGAAASQAVIDQIGQQIANTDLPLGLKQTLVAVAGAAVGAATGGAAGAASGVNATVNNYLTVADLTGKQGTKKDQQTRSMANNAKVEDACLSGTSEACGKAVAKAADDMADLRSYRATLQGQQNGTTDPATKVALGAQILTVDKQIDSASNAIRVGFMATNGGNFDPSTMTNEEIVAMGFAFDAIGAAEIRAAKRVTTSIDTLKDNVALKVEQAKQQEQARIANNSSRDGGIADPSLPMSANGGWKPAAALTPAEANALVSGSLPSGVKVTGTSSADKQNAQSVADNYLPPFVPGTQVLQTVTTQPTSFVRVYADSGGPSSQAGSWMMRAYDVAGLTAQQIASKFGLPQVPTMITNATIPSGVPMNVSAANGISPFASSGSYTGGNGGGGGVQFQITNRPTDPNMFRSWFSNARPLK